MVSVAPPPDSASADPVLDEILGLLEGMGAPSHVLKRAVTVWDRLYDGGAGYPNYEVLADRVLREVLWGLP